MARTHRSSSSSDESLPRYFAKHGLTFEDPNRVKKSGAGRLNWGREEDDIADAEESGNYTFFRTHRRSNSSTGARTLAATTDWQDGDVFEEE